MHESKMKLYVFYWIHVQCTLCTIAVALYEFIFSLFKFGDLLSNVEIENLLKVSSHLHLTSKSTNPSQTTHQHSLKEWNESHSAVQFHFNLWTIVLFESFCIWNHLHRRQNIFSSWFRIRCRCIYIVTHTHTHTRIDKHTRTLSLSPLIVFLLFGFGLIGYRRRCCWCCCNGRDQTGKTHF